MEKIIVIIGPTGVGKTKLSVELAKKLNAEIINGDSVSIYKKLNIGSAKPTIEERQNIPHHLIDVLEPNEEYSVYDYQKEVRKKIEELTKQNKRIIIVGGTGLYIKAALYDYTFVDGTTTKQYENLSNEEILTEIKKYQTEDLPHINNRKRLVRLLNKYQNNEPQTKNKNKPLYPITVIGLTTDRDNLYNIINNRVDKMLENGLLNEVNELKNEYSNSKILNSAIGYKEFKDYLFNNKNLEEVINQIKQNSRRYAKRQYTFFKHQFETNWFNVNFSDFNKTIEEIYTYINTSR